MTHMPDTVHTPSRQMPSLPKAAPGAADWLALASIATLLAYTAYPLLSEAPLATVSLAVMLGILLRISTQKRRARLLALADSRRGESICEFARSFDTRVVDTWIIRAVYEGLQEQLRDVHPAFPVRASDVMLKNLIDDPDDIDMDLAPEIAQRAGRDLDDTRDNPYYDKVHTVADLVMFFNAQSKVAAS